MNAVDVKLPNVSAAGTAGAINPPKSLLSDVLRKDFYDMTRFVTEDMTGTPTPLLNIPPDRPSKRGGTVEDAPDIDAVNVNDSSLSLILDLTSVVRSWDTSSSNTSDSEGSHPGRISSSSSNSELEASISKSASQKLDVATPACDKGRSILVPILKLQPNQASARDPAIVPLASVVAIAQLGSAKYALEKSLSIRVNPLTECINTIVAICHGFARSKDKITAKRRGQPSALFQEGTELQSGVATARDRSTTAAAATATATAEVATPPILTPRKSPIFSQDEVIGYTPENILYSPAVLPETEKELALLAHTLRKTNGWVSAKPVETSPPSPLSSPTQLPKSPRVSCRSNTPIAESRPPAPTSNETQPPPLSSPTQLPKSPRVNCRSNTPIAESRTHAQLSNELPLSSQPTSPRPHAQTDNEPPSLLSSTNKTTSPRVSCRSNTPIAEVRPHAQTSNELSLCYEPMPAPPPLSSPGKTTSSRPHAQTSNEPPLVSTIQAKSPHLLRKIEPQNSRTTQRSNSSAAAVAAARVEAGRNGHNNSELTPPSSVPIVVQAKSPRIVRHASTSTIVVNSTILQHSTAAVAAESAKANGSHSNTPLAEVRRQDDLISPPPSTDTPTTPKSPRINRRPSISSSESTSVFKSALQYITDQVRSSGDGAKKSNRDSATIGGGGGGKSSGNIEDDSLRALIVVYKDIVRLARAVYDDPTTEFKADNVPPTTIQNALGFYYNNVQTSKTSKGVFKVRTDRFFRCYDSRAFKCNHNLACEIHCAEQIAIVYKNVDVYYNTFWDINEEMVVYDNVSSEVAKGPNALKAGKIAQKVFYSCFDLDLIMTAFVKNKASFSAIRKCRVVCVDDSGFVFIKPQSFDTISDYETAKSLVNSQANALFVQCPRKIACTSCTLSPAILVLTAYSTTGLPMSKDALNNVMKNPIPHGVGLQYFLGIEHYLCIHPSFSDVDYIKRMHDAVVWHFAKVTSPIISYLFMVENLVNASTNKSIYNTVRYLLTVMLGNHNLLRSRSIFETIEKVEAIRNDIITPQLNVGFLYDISTGAGVEFVPFDFH